MRSPIKLGLTGFLATVLAGIVLIGWTERHAWRQTGQLQERFQTRRHGGFHWADHLGATILRLNRTLFRFDLRENPADQVRYKEDSEGAPQSRMARPAGAARAITRWRRA
jgi:hypothetical protein